MYTSFNMYYIHVLLSVGVVLLFSSISSDAYLMPDQKQGLIDLYTRCGGSNWKIPEHWGGRWNITDGNPCGWGGVNCRPEGAISRPQTIVELNFKSFGIQCLDGLPPTVFRPMIDLYLLDATENNMNIKNRYTFSRAQHLQRLVLNNSSLSVMLELPSSLELLYIQENNILDMTSSLDSWLMPLTNLRYLNLENINAKGDFPCHALSHLKKLKTLSLGNNHDLRGNLCSGMKTHPMLSYLNLRHTSVDHGKEFPPWIVGLDDLDMAIQRYDGPCPIPDNIREQSPTNAIICCKNDTMQKNIKDGCVKVNRCKEKEMRRSKGPRELHKKDYQDVVENNSDRKSLILKIVLSTLGVFLFSSILFMIVWKYCRRSKKMDVEQKCQEKCPEKKFDVVVVEEVVIHVEEVNDPFKS